MVAQVGHRSVLHPAMGAVKPRSSFSMVSLLASDQGSHAGISSSASSSSLLSDEDDDHDHDDHDDHHVHDQHSPDASPRSFSMTVQPARPFATTTLFPPQETANAASLLHLLNAASALLPPLASSPASALEQDQYSLKLAQERKLVPIEPRKEDARASAAGAPVASSTNLRFREEDGFYSQKANFILTRERICSNCGTDKTPLWRRDEAGNHICNACGLYKKLKNGDRPRPLTSKNVIRKRNRSKPGTPLKTPVTKSPGHTNAAKAKVAA